MRFLFAILLLLPSVAAAAPGLGEFRTSHVPNEGAVITVFEPGMTGWYLTSAATNTKSRRVVGDCKIQVNEIHDAAGRSYVQASVYRDSGDGVTGLLVGVLMEGTNGVTVSNGFYWIEVTSPPIAAWTRFTVSCVEERF